MIEPSNNLQEQCVIRNLERWRRRGGNKAYVVVVVVVVVAYKE